MSFTRLLMVRNFWRSTWLAIFACSTQWRWFRVDRSAGSPDVFPRNTFHCIVFFSFSYKAGQHSTLKISGFLT
ncbi:MAG TPA: hypothetical protein VK133_04325, partial [Amoebophilaceae bacterium]|nr:hypothetical protein [Amoebophilaceae bacterium]